MAVEETPKGKNLRRTIPVVAAILVVSVSVLTYALWWLAHDLDRRALNILTITKSTKRQSQILQILTDLGREAQEAREYQRQIESILPKKDRLLDFPQWVEGVARVNGVAADLVFEGSEVAPVGDTPGYINFSLRIDGSYENVLAFLDDLEVLARQFLVNVDRITVDRDRGHERFSTEGRVFFK